MSIHSSVEFLMIKITIQSLLCKFIYRKSNAKNNVFILSTDHLTDMKYKALQSLLFK